ncbi:MAG: protein CapI, partial [bacterium]|nr:protein CapI [bacterium]
VAGVSGALAREFDYEVFNLGNTRPVLLNTYIELLEKELGKRAEKNFLPLQLGDVPKSCADISKASRLLGYSPQTRMEQGVANFVKWYKENAARLNLDKL